MPGFGGGFVVIFKDPCKGLHAVFFGGGDGAVEDVEIAEIRGAHVGIGEGGILVILHVGDGEISAMESLGLHGGSDVGICVDEREEGVYAAAFLHVVEDGVDVAGGQRWD